MSIITDIFEINKRLSHELWHLKNISEEVNELSPNLILPFKRTKNEPRLCEQEAKIIYCNILDRLNYYYSIETPTKKVYQQKGEGYRSANIDISLYSKILSENKKKTSRVANVELKAHNPGKFSYKKDIEKLIRESIPGNWVQIIDGFNNHNSDYFDKIREKIINSFIELKSYGKKNNKISIVFYFHSIEERWSCMKYFYFDFNKNNSFKKYVKDFFDLDFKLIKKSNDYNDYYYIQSNNKNDWYTMSMRKFHDDIK